MLFFILKILSLHENQIRIMKSGIKFYNKLIFRVSIAILLPSILLAIFMIYILYQSTTKLTEEEYINHLHEVNLNYVDYINLKMDNFSSRAKMGARYIENNQITETVFLDFTKNIALSDDLIYASAIALAPNKYNNRELGFYYSYKSKNGEILQIDFEKKTDPQYFDYPNLELDWWAVPSSNLQSGWTLPYYDKEAGMEHMVTFYQPFFNDGNFQGVITIDVSLKQLRNVLLETNNHYKDLHGARILLIANDSTFLYSRNADIVGTKIEARLFHEKKWQDEARIITNALNGKIGRDIYYSGEDDEKYVAFYTPVTSTKWSAIAIIPYDIINAEVLSEISKVATILVLILIGVLILSVFLTRSISEPIAQISRQSNEIAKGDYHAKLKTTKSGEVGRLAENFNQMSLKLKEREESLIQANKELQVLDEAKNNFLVLASHEIRTPLNGMIGITSIIKDNADEETMEMVGLLEESIDRLNNLSKRALEIVQMQIRGSEHNKQNISISPLVNEIIESHIKDIEEKDIQLFFEQKDNTEYNHYGIPEYFTSTLDELISNSIKHNLGDRKIWIHVSKGLNNTIAISFKNTGPTIPTEKIKEITKPFDIGEKHNDRNTGLGLSYVWTYLQIADGELEIKSENELNDFIIILPANN